MKKIPRIKKTTKLREKAIEDSLGELEVAKETGTG